MPDEDPESSGYLDSGGIDSLPSGWLSDKLEG